MNRAILNTDTWPEDEADQIRAYIVALLGDGESPEVIARIKAEAIERMIIVFSQEEAADQLISRFKAQLRI